MPKQSDGGTVSIAALLLNIKTSVNTYASRLKLVDNDLVNKKTNYNRQTQKVTDTLEDGDDEGLALLIPNILDTTTLVQKRTEITNHPITGVTERPLSRSIEQRYLTAMKALQFGKSSSSEILLISR